MLKKRKRKFPFLTWPLFLGVGIILITIPFLRSSSFKDSSLTGEEILENQQNTIPEDVVAQLTQGEQVLGATSREFPDSIIHVPILMYHYVEYVSDPGDKTRISLDTLPSNLEAEIQTLKGAGYTFMTANDLADVIDGKTQLPPKPILLTFDDGYRDFYEYAYPLLKKDHIKATQYVITGPHFLNTPNHLTSQQVQEIAQDGLVEIGAHTVDHLWLRGLSKSIVTYEVTQSKKTLENLIHKPVNSFAYPFGAFDPQAIDVVKQAGFRTSLSTIPGINQSKTNRYFLYRLRPGGRVGKDLLYCLDHVEKCYQVAQ
ncbi:MAG TPA: polysaccharide deacetylase family protein [Patescibacteria group bacterium]|nr:polysaccharide deacetylase family protein [Patescibacteria group bacterium]